MRNKRIAEMSHRRKQMDKSAPLKKMKLLELSSFVKFETSSFSAFSSIFARGAKAKAWPSAVESLIKP